METNFLKTLGTSDIQSYINVLNAYSENCIGEDIFEVGFNSSTGYVYIALEMNIQIASCFGQSVEYIVTNYNDGEEHFFNDYDEAVDFANTLN